MGKDKGKDLGFIRIAKDFDINCIPGVNKYRKRPFAVKAVQMDDAFVVDTLEGELVASPGDYLIQGIIGEYYPCRKDIFEKTYERL